MIWKYLYFWCYSYSAFDLCVPIYTQGYLVFKSGRPLDYRQIISSFQRWHVPRFYPLPPKKYVLLIPGNVACCVLVVSSWRFSVTAKLASFWSRFTSISWRDLGSECTTKIGNMNINRAKEIIEFPIFWATFGQVRKEKVFCPWIL